MGKVWFIGDTHFFHKNILDYEDRPFKDLDEMTEVIVDNWNSCVNPDDIVFHLGDFAFGNKSKQKEVGNLLTGNKILIMGNHDRYPVEFYHECGFRQVIRYPIIYDQFWMLSHYPLYINTNMPYANIFAHVHGNPAYADFSSQTFCVSVERQYVNYKPISFDKVKDLMGIPKEQ